MPNVVINAAASFVAWLSINTGISVSTIITLSKIAGVILMNTITSKLFMPSVPSGRLSGMQVMSRTSIDYRKVTYGQAMVSGPIVYNNVQGTENQNLYFQVALTHGETDSFVSIWLDGDEIPVADINWTPGALGADGTGDGAVSTAEWVGEASATSTYLFYFLGHENQVANAHALANFPELDSNHRGRGVTYLAAFFHYDSNTEKIWQKKGLPRAIKALIKGRKVYDPRQDNSTIIDSSTSPVTYGASTMRRSVQSTWAWTDNPALCVGDYLFHIMGVDGENSIDWESIAKAADDCDVLVDVPPVASPTNTQKRFTCNGALSLGDSHRSNLNKLLSSCDGKLTYTGGVWKLRAAVWEASTVSITADDLAGDIDVRGSAPRSERFNTIRGYFVDPDRQYEVAEFPHVSASAYVTRDAGETISFDLELPFTNNQYMAQRIAYRLLEQGDNQIICQLTMNARGAKIEIGDMVDVTLSEFSWTNKTFRCISWSRETNGTFKVGLREEESGDYVDPLVSEYKTVNSDLLTVPNVNVPAPTNLTATAILNGVRLSWTDPASRLYDRIEIWQSSTDSLATASLLTTVPSSPYTDVISETFGQRYYWIRAVRSTGNVSTYEPNNSPDTGVGGYPVLQQTRVVADPLIRSGASYWTLVAATGSPTLSYVSSIGVDGTDVIRVTTNAGDNGRIFGAARRGPDTFDAIRNAPGAIRVRWRIRLTDNGTGSWSAGEYHEVGLRRAKLDDSSGHFNFADRGTEWNHLSTENQWVEDEGVVTFPEYTSSPEIAYVQVLLSITHPTGVTGPVTWEVDMLDAEILPDQFSGSGNPGIVPDPGSETGSVLTDDGTWQAVSSGYPQTAEESAAGKTPVDISYPPGNLLRWGAALDGVTDDTTAVQNCLACASGDQLRVIHPGGICMVNPITIPNVAGIEIVGEQGYNRQIADLGATFKANATSPTGSHIFAASVFVRDQSPQATTVGHPVTLRNLRFDANNAVDNCVILTNWNSLIEDCVMFNALNDGLMITANMADSTSITGTMVNNKIVRGEYFSNGRHGIYMRHDTTSSIGTDWHIVGGTYCHTNGSDGIYADSAAGAWIDGAHNYANTGWDINIGRGALGLRISNCYFDTSGTVSHTEWGSSQSRPASLNFGNMKTNEECQISDCYFIGMLKVSAAASGSGLKISDCVFAGTNAHIYMANTGNIVPQVSGCRFTTSTPFRTDTVGSSAKFIASACISEAESETITFSGLHEATGQYPLRRDAGTQTFTAADATPSIRKSKVWFTDSGTLTITDFDDGEAGDEITVISQGAITFDMTGTNLGGMRTDLVTSSGDVTRWVCEDGTNWQLISLNDQDFEWTGSALKIWDSAGLDSATFSLDGTDFNLALSSVTDWNVTGLGNASTDKLSVDASILATGNNSSVQATGAAQNLGTGTGVVAYVAVTNTLTIAEFGGYKWGTGYQPARVRGSDVEIWDADERLADFNNTKIEFDKSTFLKELTAAVTNAAGYGQFWVKDDVPNNPKFSNDAGTTFDLAKSDGTTGGTGSAGAGNQYIEIEIGGTTYKVLHDGTV